MMKKFMIFLLFSFGTAALYGQKNLLKGDTGVETERVSVTGGDVSWAAFGSFDWRYDRTTGYNSERSICIFRPGQASLPVTVDLEKGKSYTFSFYAKAARDGSSGGINCLPSDFKEWPWPSSTSAMQLQFSTEWKRYSMTFTPAKTQSYSLIYLSNSTEPVNFDNFQLEEGSAATAYEAPQNGCLGVDTADAPGEIHYLNSDLKGEVSVLSAGKGGKVEVAVLDYRNCEVGRYEFQVPAGKNELIRFKVPFKLERTGWFRLQAKWNGMTAKRDFVVTTPETQGKANFVSMCSMWMDLDILQRIGGKIYATVVNFNTCAAEPGKIVIPFKERRYHLKEAKAAGKLVKMDVYFPPPPRLMSDADKAAMKKYSLGPKRFLPEENAIEDWKKFISTLVDEWGEYIDIYEFGGEYDVQIGANPYYKQLYPDATGHRVAGRPMELYAKFVSIASEIIRAKYPNAKITAVRPCDVDCRSNFYFSRGVYSRAAKGTFNSFGIDNYASPRRIGENEPDPGAVSDMIWQYKQALDVLQKTGSKSDYIFISEYGYDIWLKDADRLPYRTQYASALVQSMLIARAVGFKHLLYYTAFNRNSRPGVTVTYANYFLYQPMVSIAAFCHMARILEDVTAAGVSQPAEGVVFVWFKRSDNSGFGAVWSAPLKSDTIIRMTPVETRNMMGNAVGIEKKNGKIEFSVSHEPLFFEHKNFDELVKVIKSAEVVPVMPLQVLCRMEAPGRLSVNLRSKLKARSVKGTVKVGNTVKNFSANPFMATPVVFDISAKAGESVEYTIAPEKHSHPAKGKFIVPVINTIPRIAPVNLDGDPAKYRNIPVLNFDSGTLVYPIDVHSWSGTDDLSVKLQLAHDGKFLYIAAAVRDDFHCNPYSGTSTVRGDVLQVVTHPFKNTAAGKYPHDTNLALALTDAGVITPVVYYGPDKSVLTGKNCFVKRFEDKKITFYEMKLSLKSLKLDPASGQAFGFGAVVFDSDSGKRWDYYMNLYPGVTGGYNPERFGVFNFSTK